MRTASEDLISSFLSLSDEQQNLFSEERLSSVSQELSSYYSGTIAENSPVTDERVSVYLPSDARTIVSQYLYVFKNPESIGQKAAFSSYNDNSSYSNAHANYHKYLNDIRKLVHASDLYLIDPQSGYVVYTTQKNIDFGVNLFEGVLKNSKLAEAFQAAVAQNKSAVYMSDFANYMPAGDKPVTFMAVPVFYYNQSVAILVVQYETEIFDDLFYDESVLADESSLEYTLIGNDMKLRNNPKKFIADKDNFLKVYLRQHGRKMSNAIINYAQTGDVAMLVQYSIVYKNALFSEDGILIKDYNNKSVLAYSQKLPINHNDDLLLVTKIDRSEVLKPFRNQLLLYIVLSLVIFYIIYIAVRSFGNSFSERLKNLLEGMLLLYNGEKAKEIGVKNMDELGDALEAYNKLRKRINSAEEFALEMSDGNYNYNFKILSEKDSLGKSLNVLKDTLIESRDEHEARAKEDEIRNWVNDGVAKFNDLLRENTTDIKLLGFSLIENLINYLDANVGGIFLVEGDSESEKHIDLLASYAYDRRKYHTKSVEIGEGMLGACYLEKKPIFLKSIPENYIEVTSGLGHEVPNCLYIVPLKVDEDVLGMIEIASFTEFSQHQIEFVNRVADSIAATFVSVRLNMKTATLLEESKRKAEEIAQQEEEMRQNLEEMQATQEELARLRQDDEKRTQEMQLLIDDSRLLLKNLLDAIPGGYILKDANGIIHLVNTEGAEYYGLSTEKILGKTDHELLGGKLYQAENKKDQEALEKGEKEYTEEHEIGGSKIKYRVIKKPFEIFGIGQTGVLTIRNKI